MLHIVEPGNGTHPIAKGGMRRHILHLLPTDVDLGGAFPQPRNVFLACPGWHGFFSYGAAPLALRSSQ
jgi:hypothetical protein